MYQTIALDASPASISLLEQFYSTIYVDAFPDPNERELLGNMVEYLQRRQAGWFGSNSYHILVAVHENRPVAGVVGDYLHLPNSGVIEFLTVAPELRCQAWAGSCTIPSSSHCDRMQSTQGSSTSITYSARSMIRKGPTRPPTAWIPRSGH